MVAGCRFCKYGGKKSKTRRKRQKQTSYKVHHVNKELHKSHKKHKKHKHQSTKKKYSGGGTGMHAAEKTWVCRGNIGCARNINIYN